MMVVHWPGACFGCGSTAHLLRDCPMNSSKGDRQVQEVSADEPEVLFIGHTGEGVRGHPRRTGTTWFGRLDETTDGEIGDAAEDENLTYWAVGVESLQRLGGGVEGR